MKKSSILIAAMMTALVGGCAPGGSEPARSDGTAIKPTRPASKPEAGSLPAGTVVAPGPDDPAIATIDGAVIRQSAVTSVLIESQGLDVLMKLVQFEMAKAEAVGLGASVTEQDFAAERARTIKLAFPEIDQPVPNDPRTPEQRQADVEKQGADLLQQLLQQQGVSEAEFDIVMRTNAYLRAIARPQVAKRITENDLQDAFGRFYGEKVKVRHIALANMQEVAEAKTRLAAGEAFEKVAGELSRASATASLGGALAPFARNAPGLTPAFADAAFALTPGQVSDPVQSDGFFHLIKLEEKIAPKVVKFENVKEAIREQLQVQNEQATMAIARQALARRAMQNLRVEHPVLKKQYQARLEAAQPKAADREEIRKQLATTPATRPAN
jgi:PPIC-type PPIASE domain